MAPVPVPMSVSSLRTRDEPSSVGGGGGCPSTISGGGIAGIVLGTIAGTLLLLWLFRLCTMPREEGVLTTRTQHRRRRRRRSPGFYYVEKPRGEVRRPAKVYLS
ncbi:hypothetical protein BO70DRAFT_357773 [Aspergillus heteromorphus CBS 117.55]|uniref:Uncharacterized protein n=1 Tax=Aspergillus heteromorphus CBS 117.55 TaxID=1448321 RepID=A0A317X2R3_9EURO|nr:uncharacterized protein BO70DRAFT_357773 [Aspergillus heteromorphus CBS 117.55]PWY92635.1 hypothetical protein BO70DRAFT_357773 [Aspergillus heteromorphus CBS 117.55]